MGNSYAMTLRDVFQFRDGRTVLVGEVEGHDGYIPRSRFEVRLHDDLCGLLDVEGEMISHRLVVQGGTRLRSLSNTTTFALNREFLIKGPLILKSTEKLGGRESQMHRHLLGVDSPPSDLLADPMTQGPVLPEGWDGDAWERPGGGDDFLRAWNKECGLVAYGRGSTYEEARRCLLDNLRDGSRRVVISSS